METTRFSDSQLLVLVRKILMHRGGQVCKHTIAADVLELMEQGGYPLNEQVPLVSAVVEADDETALKILNDLIGAP